MDYPDWKEIREGMWAAELNFPMIDEETPTFINHGKVRRGDLGGGPDPQLANQSGGACGSRGADQ